MWRKGIGGFAIEALGKAFSFECGLKRPYRCQSDGQKHGLGHGDRCSNCSRKTSPLGKETWRSIRSISLLQTVTQNAGTCEWRWRSPMREAQESQGRRANAICPGYAPDMPRRANAIRPYLKLQNLNAPRSPCPSACSAAEIIHHPDSGRKPGSKGILNFEF